jgi:hypothetical protein
MEGDLYAGGSFTHSGEVNVNNIAQWNGTAWTALGAGTDGPVLALAASSNELYVGGTFSAAGGIPASNVAKWSLNQWSNLGVGLNGRVSALMVHDGDLYAGGSFDRAGGAVVNSIAIWNGTTWSPLGSGIGVYPGIDGYSRGGVGALAVRDTELFAGGNFLFAGGKVSAYLARAFLEGVPSMEVEGLRATAYFRGMPAGAYQIDRSTHLPLWETLGIRHAGSTGGFDFTDEEAPPSSAIYRAYPLEP